MHQDFTTAAYRELLKASRARYRFQRFGDAAEGEGLALWRHDIDFSPQRALAISHLETEAGCCATYFVQLSSCYYSAFEPETAMFLRQIAAGGHDIGLHYDPQVCAGQPLAAHEVRIAFEARVLTDLLETPVRSFTLHNPTTLAGVAFDAPSHAGLLNGSAPLLRADYVYCSDSNGLWRFRSLAEAVADPKTHRLYVLTHPELWQDVAMLPRQRIQRCIDGRAKFCAELYDNLLAENDRPNLGGMA